MANEGRRARLLRRWLVILLLSIGAIGLAIAAVRSAAVRALPPEAGVAAWLDPANPDALFRRASTELLSNRGRLSDETYAQLADAASRQPLASEPFAFFGMRALTRNDIGRAERLLVEARRRNPRNRIVRLALTGLYLQADRTSDASTEIATLTKLVPQTSQLLVPELARLAAAPATSSAVVRAIGADPLMAEVLLHLVGRGADTDLILRLAARQPRLQDGRLAPWQAQLVDRLVERGEVARAHAIWSRLFGQSRREGELIYDADFTGRPGSPPFNWALTSAGLGSAERIDGPALEVEYFGRGPGVLASQLLLLPPGRYELALRAQGSANGQGSRLEWKVTCREGGPPLLTLPLTDVTYTPRAVEGGFTVPAAGCSSQWLRLEGAAAEFPTTQAVEISDLSLRAAGARR